MQSIRLSSFYFVYFITIGVILPYWGLHLKAIGFSPTEIGQLMAILLVTKVVAPMIWATITDNIKVRTGNTLGLIKFATFMTLLIFSSLYWLRDFWAVALAMFGFCLFWNACLPQLEAATMSHLEGDKHRYGVIRLWGSIGFIISVLVLGILIDLWGVKVIQPAGMLAMMGLMLTSFWFTQGNVKVDQSKTDYSHISLKRLLSPLVIGVLVLCFLMQLSHAPFYTFFTIYLESYHYSKTVIGWLWTLGVICEIGIFITSYRLLKQTQIGYLLSLTFGVAAIRWVLLAFFPENLPILVLVQVMHAVTYGLYHCVMMQLIDRFFIGRYQIRGQALYTSVTFGLGGAVGSVLSGYIWSIYGAQTLFAITGYMMFFVMLVSLAFVQRLEPFSHNTVTAN